MIREISSRDEYIKALENMDWFYYMSDDHAVYESGRRNNDVILYYANTFDPDLSLYKKHKPELRF